MRTSPTDTGWQDSPDYRDTIRSVPIFGDIAGGFGMSTSAERNKQKALERSMQMLVEYRPEQLQARQTAMDNAMSLFQPVNNALVNAYGPGAALPLAQATQMPFSDQAMAQMQSQANPKPVQKKPPSEAERRKHMRKNHGGLFFPF